MTDYPSHKTDISPSVGTAIGFVAGSVAGYAVGVEMDDKDMKATSRARKELQVQASASNRYSVTVSKVSPAFSSAEGNCGMFGASG